MVFLCDRHCAKCFAWIISFTLSTNKHGRDLVFVPTLQMKETLRLEGICATKLAIEKGVHDS